MKILKTLLISVALLGISVVLGGAAHLRFNAVRGTPAAISRFIDSLDGRICIPRKGIANSAVDNEPRATNIRSGIYLHIAIALSQREQFKSLSSIVWRGNQDISYGSLFRSVSGRDCQVVWIITKTMNLGVGKYSGWSSADVSGFNSKRSCTIALNKNNNPRSLRVNNGLSIQQSSAGAIFGSFYSIPSSLSLVSDGQKSTDSDANADSADETQNEVREVLRRNDATEVRLRFIGAIVGLIGGALSLHYVESSYVRRFYANRIWKRRLNLWLLRAVRGLLLFGGMCCGFLPIYWDYDATYSQQ